MYAATGTRQWNGPADNFPLDSVQSLSAQSIGVRQPPKFAAAEAPH